MTTPADPSAGLRTGAAEVHHAIEAEREGAYLHLGLEPPRTAQQAMFD